MIDVLRRLSKIDTIFICSQTDIAGDLVFISTTRYITSALYQIRSVLNNCTVPTFPRILNEKTETLHQLCQSLCSIR